MSMFSQNKGDGGRIKLLQLCIVSLLVFMLNFVIDKKMHK